MSHEASVLHLVLLAARRLDAGVQLVARVQVMKRLMLRESKHQQKIQVSASRRELNDAKNKKTPRLIEMRVAQTI